MHIKKFNVHLKKIRFSLVIFIFSGLLAQILLDQSFVNILCALLASTSSILIVLYTFNSKQWLIYPASTLILLGFAVTQSIGPLLFTALEMHPIIFNLEVPEQVFINAFLCTLTLILAHIIYQRNSSVQKFRFWITHVLKIRLNIFQPLLRTQAVMAGAFGLGAMVFVYWHKGLGSETFLTKFIQGFIPFSYLPIVLLLKPLQGESASANRAEWVINLVFFALILIISLGSNSRGSFALPVAIYFLGLIISWIYQKLKIRIIFILITLFSVYFILPFFNNLATAMVLVRGRRNDIPTTQLISETFKALENTQQIELYRLGPGNRVGWNESYVSNPFLSRFSNLKFADNAISLSEKLSDSKKTIFQSFLLNRLASLAPGPLLDILGLSSELKLQVTSYSIGDQLYFLASGNPSAIGGFRTGHFYGTGLAAFSWFYLVIYLLLMIPFFMLNDSLILTSGLDKLSGLCERTIFFSSLSIINLYDFLEQGNIESLLEYPSFIFRGFPQQVILFVILMKLTSFIEKVFKLNTNS